MKKLVQNILMAVAVTGLAGAQTSAPAPAKPAPTTAAKSEGSTAAKPATRSRYSSRRDPFLNPVKMRNDAMSKTVACSTGARCLMVDQVTLKGIVKTQQGMIAMVENSAKKQYNLREKDPVYNGFVLKITGDSVVFKENATDPSGRPMTREVVKRVTVPVV